MVPKEFFPKQNYLDSTRIPCGFLAKCEDSLQIPEEWGCLEWLESMESLWNPHGMVQGNRRTRGVTGMSHLRVEICNTRSHDMSHIT